MNQNNSAPTIYTEQDLTKMKTYLASLKKKPPGYKSNEIIRELFDDLNELTRMGYTIENLAAAFQERMHFTIAASTLKKYLQQERKKRKLAPTAHAKKKNSANKIIENEALPLKTEDFFADSTKKEAKL